MRLNKQCRFRVLPDGKTRPAERLAEFATTTGTATATATTTTAITVMIAVATEVADATEVVAEIATAIAFGLARTFGFTAVTNEQRWVCRSRHGDATCLGINLNDQRRRGLGSVCRRSSDRSSDSSRLKCGVVIALVATLAVCGLPRGVTAGGVPGIATELTQRLNNAELGRLASLETSQLSIAGETLATEVEQLRTLILAYRNMVANTERLPGSFHRSAHDAILRLRRMYMQAGSLMHAGKELDGFLRSDQITDPLFGKEGYERNRFSERYDALQSRWTAALATGLGQAGLTSTDVETEAQLIDVLSNRASSAEGNLAALQVANELATSLSRQLLDLRSLQAAQAEQTAIAWSRVLMEMDAREAMQRRYDDRLTDDRRDVSSGAGIHQLLGIVK